MSTQDQVINSQQEENPSPYLHDLKNTLEFDRKCRALESLFQELEERVNLMEFELSKCL